MGNVEVAALLTQVLLIIRMLLPQSEVQVGVSEHVVDEFLDVALGGGVVGVGVEGVLSGGGQGGEEVGCG